jgi:hypothetical protein
MTEIPDAASRARQMYADGAPVKDIIAATGLTQAVVYRWLDGGGVLPAVPRRYAGRARPRRKRGRAATIECIRRAADKQVREISERLAEDGVPLSEREQRTRSLAVLAKTMRELIALDTAEAEAKKLQTRADDDSIPRDIDELRRELTRRLNALLDARQAGARGGDERVAAAADGERA